MIVTTFTEAVTFTGNNYNISFYNTSNAIKFFDNAKAQFGTGGDLEIRHNGNHSLIKDTGTGQLRISSDVVHLMNSDNSESMVKATENGAVELYHNNVKKLETTSSGVTVTGTITSTGIGQFNDYIDLNTAGNRGKIGYDSNNVYIGSTASAGQIIFKNAITSTDAPQTSGTELMRIDSSGRVGIDVSNMSDYYATDLVVGCADEGGITLSTTSTSRNYIMFADGASGGTERFMGQISYDLSLIHI